MYSTGKRKLGFTLVVLLSALVIIFCAECAMAQTNLVQDPSFESPIVAPPSPTYYGGSLLGPWSVGGNSIELVHYTPVPGNWPAAEGDQSVDLSGTNLISPQNSAGSISQALNTIPGQEYLLSFAMAGNFYGYPTVKQMNVYWGGNIIASPTFDITGHSISNMGWIVLSYSVTATSSSTVLEFESLVGNYYGPTLDNVSVAPVPEPATMCLLGLGGLALLRRRKV